MAAVESDAAVDVKFRLADGSDLGPFNFGPETTVVALKEKVVSNWPAGNEPQPKSHRDVKLINGGRLLEDARTLSESRVPMGELPGAPITMHVVIRPSGAAQEAASADKEAGAESATDRASTRCGCVIL